ncbi:hypothetical protein, partial [Archangium sp.]|uniref:hypothetical protein n=1 Tax=Archangium sp. TaxID=1872627 RepID=UPI00286B13A8
MMPPTNHRAASSTPFSASHAEPSYTPSRQRSSVASCMAWYQFCSGVSANADGGRSTRANSTRP